MAPESMERDLAWHQVLASNRKENKKMAWIRVGREFQWRKSGKAFIAQGRNRCGEYAGTRIALCEEYSCVKNVILYLASPLPIVSSPAYIIVRLIDGKPS